MRTTRLFLSWSAIVLMSGAGAACASANGSAADGLRSDDGIARLTSDERRQLRDSAAAQAVADEVGPRVTVRADFDFAAGARQVDATFHMYDDGYVIVGHLDAAGRLKIVFPSAPGDDGFVRGDKVYHVPTFFAGFNDEYAQRYSNFRYSAHNYASRTDSYDAGLGYVFVIASWRPMRLDRIADGSHWQTYEVSDITYMSDPREAVEELGSVIAGDNREAYTIEYAKYYTTNYGNYAFSDFDAANGGCPYGSSLGFGFGVFGGRNLFSPFGYGFGGGCQSAFNSLGYGYGYGYGYPYYGYPVTYAPFTGAPPIRHGSITTPYGLGILHLPRVDVGGLAIHPPGTPTPTVAGSTTPYRRPGLIAEEAGGGRVPGERRPTGSGLGLTSTQRPTIQQMIGGRKLDEDSRGRGFTRDNPSSTNAGGSSAPRGAETRTRWGDGGSNARGGVGHNTGEQSRATPRGEGYGGGARTVPSHAGGESMHASPPRSEPAAHVSPTHSEPAARSAPAPAASSSSGSKKP